MGPVGSGKTMGVAGWVLKRHLEAGSIWLVADASWTTESLAPFLDRIDPSSGTPALVVIDDAHLLPRSVLSDIIARVRDLPDSLRLVLISLVEPRGDWLGADLAGNVTRLNAELLRLDDEESAVLIAAHARTRSREVARTIARRADGWSAAVVLMARALGSSPDPVAAAGRLESIGPQPADRVADEAFATMSERERHVLLCVANEGDVRVDLAARLSADPEAGRVLDGLATVGLLVTSSVSRPEHVLTYAVHPLLAEVVRRRIATGGVDVTRAAATVRGAVDLDVARGHTEGALRRLVTMGQDAAAEQLIVSRGLALILRGDGASVAEFARQRPQVVEDNPGTWVPVMYGHWYSDETVAAAVWLDRIIGHVADPVELATAHLLRARLGLEASEPAVVDARSVVAAAQSGDGGTATLDLYYELGVTECWVGDYEEARQHLLTVVRIAESRDLPALAVAARSHVAVVLMLQSSNQVAVEYIADILSGRLTVSRSVRDRCRVVADMVAVEGLPSEAIGSLDPDLPISTREGDPTLQFLVQYRRAEVLLFQGDLVGATRALEAPPRPAVLPESVLARLTIARGTLAALTRDRVNLKALRDRLTLLGQHAGAALLGGWIADLNGNRRAAYAAWHEAADGSAAPAVRAIALTCLAQVADDLGNRVEALDLLQQAVTMTEPSRRAVPFRGWVRHGRPMASLLAEYASQTENLWAQQLAEALANRPPLVAIWADSLGEVQSPVSTVPVLTPRERAVLDELARGATYADIAHLLVVSENTVKTHVSSLYSKLSATRRSEALAAARQLRLL